MTELDFKTFDKLANTLESMAKTLRYQLKERESERSTDIFMVRSTWGYDIRALGVELGMDVSWGVADRLCTIIREGRANKLDAKNPSPELPSAKELADLRGDADYGRFAKECLTIIRDNAQNVFGDVTIKVSEDFLGDIITMLIEWDEHEKNKNTP